MKNLYVFINSLGLDLIKLLNSLRGIPNFFKGFLKILMNNRSQQFKIRILPILSDKFDSAGNSKGVYFKQDNLVAQKIYFKKPELHLDIGSRIDGFVSIISIFTQVRVADIRPMESPFKSIEFIQLDLMNQNLEKKYKSISCLHALEHFGLGRYGDPIDFLGHEKGLKNICSLLDNDGTLYLSIPIGENKMYYNAHRTFSIKYLSNLFSELDLRVVDFDLINDQGVIIENLKYSNGLLDNFGCKYGCGIFTLMKNE